MKKLGDIYFNQEMSKLKTQVGVGKLKKGSDAYKKKVAFLKQVAEKMNEVTAPEAEAATEQKKERKERSDKGATEKFNEMGAEWDKMVGKNTRDIVDRHAQDIQAGNWTLHGPGGNNKNGIGRYQNYVHKDSGAKIQVKEVGTGLFQVKLWGPKPEKEKKEKESKPKKGSKGGKNTKEKAEADKGKGTGVPPSPLSPNRRSSRAATAAELACIEFMAPENFKEPTAAAPTAAAPTAAAPTAAAPTAAAPTAAAPTAAAPTAAAPTAAEKKNKNKRGAAAAPAGDKRPRRACAK